MALLLHHKVVASRLLLAILQGVPLVYPRPEGLRITSEADVQVLQETVHAIYQPLRRTRRALHSRLAVEDNYALRKSGRHDEVVLDDESGLVQVRHDPALNHLRYDYPLPDIQPCTGLVQQVDVRRRAEADTDSHALQFATGEAGHLEVLERLDAHRSHDEQTEATVAEC